METLGEILKKLRTERKLTLRDVAAHLQIDVAILSKIERGQRNPCRNQIINIATFYKVRADDLLVAYLSDKVLNEIGKDELAIKALKRAQQTVMLFQHSPSAATQKVIQKIKIFFKNDDRVASAHLFGAYAKGEETNNAKIDIMVEFSSKKYGFYEQLDIAYFLQKRINIPVNIVEKKSAQQGLFTIKTGEVIKIY